MPYSWTARLNMVKMSVLLEFTSRYSAIPIEFQQGVL